MKGGLDCEHRTGHDYRTGRDISIVRDISIRNREDRTGNGRTD